MLARKRCGILLRSSIQGIPLRNLSHETPPKVLSLFNGLIGNKRADLARSITMVETSNPEKKKLAQMLLNLVLGDLREKRNKSMRPSLRIGDLIS